MKITAILISMVAATTAAEGVDISIYHDLGTTHLSKYNSELNNDNDVKIVKVNDFLIGSMTNSYGDDGYFFGYQPEVYRNGKLGVQLGATAVTGYQKCTESSQTYAFSHGRTYIVTSYDCHEQLYVLPIASISYDLNEHVSLQVNNMLEVVNWGIKVNF